MIWTIDKLEFITKALKWTGGERTITRKESVQMCERFNMPLPHWFFNDRAFRGSQRGIYKLPEVPKPILENIGSLRARRRA